MHVGGSNIDEGQTMRVQRMVKRCSFEPLDFIADEALMGVDKEIIKVQTV